MPRPFRFGVLAWKAADKPGWQSLARRVEALGYSALLMGDHVWDQFAPVPALMAAADATERLRIGSLVLGNDFRHPVVLAKELATLDVLSEGRLDVGIGAGWFRSDYETTGLLLDPPGVRIERLVEAVAVLKGAWSTAPFSFDGGHYQVRELTGSPAPVQQPHPPLFMGGGGAKMLAAAARHADIVGINPSLRSGQFGDRDASMTSTEQRVAVVREAAGERLGQIELSMMCHVAAEEHDVAALEPALRRFGLDVEQRHDSPHVWLGRPAQVAERLAGIRERLGISYWVVQQELFEHTAPVVALLAGQ
jgi:probable F420-dependent oxidoreductase